MRRLILAILIVCLFIPLGILKSYQEDKGSHTDTEIREESNRVLPNAQNRAHTVGNLWLSVSNWGFLGSQGRDIKDSQTGEPLPSCAFPGGSDLEYLFQGSIWVGAIAEDETLVSVGCDGWFWTYEMAPDTGTSGAMIEGDWLGDQEFIAIYTDSVLPPESHYIIDPDWPDWARWSIPLGIEVRQHSYSWSASDYDDFVILDYGIKNIGEKFLSGAYIGFYMDTDITHASKLSYTGGGYLDDITGFLKWYKHSSQDSIQVNIAWAVDNDGDPDEGEWDSTLSTKGVLGVKLLDSSNPDARFSYHWWVSSHYPKERDWGPWLKESQDLWKEINPYGTGEKFPDGVLGTPGGDVSKYFLMQNGEIDYDQIFCFLDHTIEGWLSSPDSEYATHLANGIDTRFLLSFGPFEISPGDSIFFAVAVVGGEGFHVNPDDFENYFDPQNPKEFYSKLNFDDLVANALKAQEVYESRYRLPPPGPPSDLKIDSWASLKVSLTWSPKNAVDLKGYNVYRSEIPGLYVDPPINANLFRDTVYTDQNLKEGAIYYYVVTSVDSSGGEGLKSEEIEFLAGRPHSPSKLRTHAEKGRVSLEWLVHFERDLVGHKIYRRESNGPWIMIDSVGIHPAYCDQTVTNGIVYYYRVAAVDSKGLESFPSDSIYALPMGFDQGILVIDQTAGNFVDPDSVNAFYQRALLSYTHTYADHTNLEMYPLSLPELSPYSAVILHSEDLLCCPLDDSTFTILKHYLKAGGKLIIEGRRIFQHTYTGFWQFGPGSFVRDYLHIEKAYCPRWGDKYSRDEFVGAFSQIAEYSDGEIDINRVKNNEPISLGNVLPGVGYIQGVDSAEVIYTYHSIYSDTSELEGKPVGIRYLGRDYRVIYFSFPFYFIQEEQAIKLLHQALEDLNKALPEDKPTLPADFSLKQNYPNPFNQKTVIEYELIEDTKVSLVVYNVLGQRVRILVDGFEHAGFKSTSWDGKDDDGKEVSSGIYLYRLQIENFTQTKKMLLLK